MVSQLEDRAVDHGGAGWWLDLDALDSRLPARWLGWANSPRGSAAVGAWNDAQRPSAGWTPDELVSPVWSRATDRMQAALVARAQAGSAEAGLTLLVQLRPGLIRLARSAGRWDWIMTHDVHEEVQATFFETVFRHRLERRDHRIAANLLLDTRQKLWRRFPRSGPPTVDLGTGTAPDRTPDPGPSSGIDELALWLHLGQGLRELPGSEESRRMTAAMAYRAWIADEPTVAIATDFGVAPQTVTTRLYRLRRFLQAEW